MSGEQLGDFSAGDTTRFDLCYNVSSFSLFSNIAGDTTRFDLCYNTLASSVYTAMAGDTTRFDLCYNRYKINYLIY